jgi:hypothetical protein
VILSSPLRKQINFTELKQSRGPTELQALFELYGEIKGSGISPASLFIPVRLSCASDTTSTNCKPPIWVRSTIAQEIKGHNFITATLTTSAVNHNGHACFEKTQNVMSSL